MSSLTAIAFFVAVVQPAQEIGGCSTPSFAEAADSPFDAGTVPFSVAVGDFDLDGKPDLAIANVLSDDVTIRLGDGMGGFPDARSSTISASISPVSVAVGDLNLDGKLDLAVANAGSFRFPTIEGNVTIHLGDGTGGFPAASSSTVDVGGFPVALAIGDFDLDGKPDLAVANGSDYVTIRRGDGSGAFPDADSLAVSVGSAPRKLAIGDLDLDGKPDLVVTRDLDVVTVCLGDGTGGFPDAGKSTVGAGSHPWGVAIGDLDLDGRPDLAIANVSSDDVTIRLADEPGEFPDARSSTVSAGDETRAVAIADLNLDGNPDLAIASSTLEDDVLTIRLGDGMGGFPEAASATFGMGLALWVATGDFDLDGKPDLAVACELPDGVTVLRNTCAAFPCSGTSFARFTGAPFTGHQPTCVAAGDLDLDGWPDLAIANTLSDDVTIRLNDGTGNFPDAMSSTVGAGDSPNAVSIADLDLDGKPDLAVSNYGSNDVTIRPGDGAGGFPDDKSSTVGAGGFPWMVAVEDLDLDGKPDLAIVSASTNNLTIRLADEPGEFPDAMSSTVNVGGPQFWIASGDFDLDGEPDLAVAKVGSYEVAIRLGDGTGGFPDAQSSTVPVGLGPISVAVGDFDLDGKPDLAITSIGDDSVTIRLGDGTGSFPVATTESAGDHPLCVKVGDFDLDGNPDLAITSAVSNDVTIRLGDGEGGFPDAKKTTVSALDSARFAAVADFDRDGRPDLAVCHQPFGSVPRDVTVLLNTCSSNQPPLADAGEAQVVECAGATTQVTLEGSGSSDPDEDLLTYSWSENGTEIATGASPTVSLATGSHAITLTVTDPDGQSSTADVTVDVVDTTAPTITPTTNVISLPRPNHKYVNFTVAALASGASDGCDSAIDLADVVISSVSSDEPDNANGNGDGNTLQDIVIAAGCKSVRLRNERAEAGNGRVYTITLKVEDTAGNVGTATRRVFVPVVSGVPATDDGAGAGHTVQGCSP